MELFGDSFVPSGLALTMRPRCPRCVWTYLRPVSSPDATHFLCESCKHCWHFEHGRLRAVDPVTCHGCAEQSKADCIAVLAGAFPRFGNEAFVDAATASTN